MIIISDLNVSQQSCLNEVKDAEMMGHIMGGFIAPPPAPPFTPAPRLQITFPTVPGGNVAFAFRLGTFNLLGGFLTAEVTANF